uniref:Uncharacterized protein n=1 Tax=Setaria italica TaxID=4555 RepID=K3ZPN2_SETIT
MVWECLSSEALEAVCMRDGLMQHHANAAYLFANDLM